jgi:hypothetical protein
MGAMGKIASGYSTVRPMCFARTRDGVLMGVNGYDRGWRWNGITAQAELLGMIGPTAGPFVALLGGGGSNDGAYTCCYRFADDSVPDPISSPISATYVINAVEHSKFSWTGLQAVDTRPGYWNTASNIRPTERYTHVELWRTTVGINGVAGTVFYRVGRFTTGFRTSVTYCCTLTNNGSGKCRITCPNTIDSAVGLSISTSSSTAGYNGVYHNVTALVGATAFDTDVAYTTNANVSFSVNGYAGDATGDSTLQYNATVDPSSWMSLLNPDGTLNASRQVYPPTHKPYMVMHQDRTWYAGYAAYRQGTVSTTAGNANITGSGTSWPDEFNYSPKVIPPEDESDFRYIWIDNEPAPLIVTACSGGNAITLQNPPTLTQSGVNYWIGPPLIHRRRLLFSEIDEPESVPRVNVIDIQENTGDDDAITGLIPEGQYLYVLAERHVYRVTYVAQPHIDASVTMVAGRGCVNHRCWSRAENNIYLLDQSGIWLFGGGYGNVTPIGLPIGDLFRDGVIDWSKKDWFFSQDDPMQEVIRWYVSFVGDSGTRPKRWLEYNYRAQVWSTGSAVVETGGSCLAIVSGKLSVLVGGEYDTVYRIGSGAVEHVTSVVRGTATSATSTTLVDSSAPFSSVTKGAPLAIVSGTGKWQMRKVATISGDFKTLTVSPDWTTTPDSTSHYCVGAIHYQWTSNQYYWVGGQMEVPRGVSMKYQPTLVTSGFALRLFTDYATTADVFQYDYDNPGKAVSISTGSTDAIFNTASIASGNGKAMGWERLDIPGRCTEEGHSGRAIQFDLEGIQEGSAMMFYTVTIFGVLPDNAN